MSVAAIKNNLIIKLQAMQTLKDAFAYEASNIAGNFPYATVTLREGDGKFVSTAHNLRRRSFRIRIYQEMAQAGQGIEMAESISTAVIDELETALDNDITLSGTCKYVEPIDWRATYQNREHDTRVLEANVDAYEIVTVRLGP